MDPEPLHVRFPAIGNKLVSDIDSADILTVLTPIWTTKSETARKVRQRVATVLDWTIAQSYRVDNPAGKTILSVLPKVRRTKQHYPALHYNQVPSALRTIRQSTGNPKTKLAFEFLVLTAARSGEVRSATWCEIDLDNRIWTVPAGRMKARHEHQVPLSSKATAVPHEARVLNIVPGELVFPTCLDKPLSDMALTMLLRRLGIPAVPHGFRSSFKDWSMECFNDSWTISEAALAHRLGNATEIAYARSILLEQRRPLMEAWASFLSNGVITDPAKHPAA
jgi:integrase